MLTVCIQTILIDVVLTVNLQLISLQRGVRTNCQTFITDGGLTCGYCSSGYAYIFANLQTVVVHYSLTGSYAVCSYSINVDVFIQLYLIVCSFTFFSSVGNSNIAAAFYFSVFSCGCCYVGKFLIQFADCGSSAIAICDITFFYLAVLQIANLVVQVVYSVNNGSMAFAVLNVIGNIINIAYVTCFCYVFDGNGINLVAVFINNIHINLIVCTNAVFTRFDMGIGITCLNRCIQLTYVYSIGISYACCYAGNLTACYIQATADGCSVFTKHDGFCTIISTDIAHANTAVSNCKVFITIGNDDAIFIQVNFGISIGNRGNISQIACNINLVFQMTISSSHRVHCCIFAVR